MRLYDPPCCVSLSDPIRNPKRNEKVLRFEVTRLKEQWQLAESGEEVLSICFSDLRRFQVPVFVNM